MEPWHYIFYGASVLLFLECIVYFLLAAGEEQEWNKVDHHGTRGAAYQEDDKELKELESPA